MRKVLLTFSHIIINYTISRQADFDDAKYMIYFICTSIIFKIINLLRRVVLSIRILSVVSLVPYCV